MRHISDAQQPHVATMRDTAKIIHCHHYREFSWTALIWARGETSLAPCLFLKIKVFWNTAILLLCECSLAAFTLQ